MELPIEEQKEFKMILKWKGWESIEELEDVIGEENSCSLFFNHEIEVDDNINYDLEITIKRIRRSNYEISK